MRYLVRDGYCIWCSSINKLDNLELFIDHHHYFLCLNFSFILLTSLKFYSIDKVTTAHAQSSQGCVQIIEGTCTCTYNRVFKKSRVYCVKNVKGMPSIQAVCMVCIDCSTCNQSTQSPWGMHARWPSYLRFFFTTHSVWTWYAWQSNFHESHTDQDTPSFGKLSGQIFLGPKFFLFYIQWNLTTVWAKHFWLLYRGDCFTRWKCTCAKSHYLGLN